MCNSFTSLLANYVYTKHTPLSFASWCMLHIHNSASLRGVCADTPLSFASLVYLLHIHNSAAPRLCIFPYTILSSDVRHYYLIRRVKAQRSNSANRGYNITNCFTYNNNQVFITKCKSCDHTLVILHRIVVT